ncbi:MAG: hypothetical protein ACRD4T_11750 [Candidatus Acidiferrales bacterium]
MILKYSSGIEIKKGDRVLYDGELGEIELVASEAGNPETGWFLQEYGGGVMVRATVFGRVFLAADQLETSEELEFVARAEEK